MASQEKKTTKSDSLYEVKVTLLDSRPPIWRRFQVESGATLQRLHRILQIVMGWDDSHLHGFRVPARGRSGVRRSYLSIEEADESTQRLDDVLRRPEDRLVYVYDFGDDWEHELVLEAVVPRASGVKYPLVLAGRGACPPEDVGGISGFYEFLEAIQDPEHPAHDEIVEWGGDEFDPESFDVEAVNRALHRRR